MRPRLKNSSFKAATFVVPFPAGGSNDVAARAATEGARSRLGQTVVIDNQPGANGSLGVEAVSRAPKDQHTFLIASDSVPLLLLFRATPWDLSKSFIPVTLLSIQPMVLPKNETMKRTASTLALTSAIACFGLPLVATQACAQDTVTCLWLRCQLAQRSQYRR